jgi:dipeptide/tripeptide permease
MVLGRVHEAGRSRALGVMYSFLFLGSFLNPLLVAPLMVAFGSHGALLATAAMLAAGAASAAVLVACSPKRQHGLH